MNTTTTLQTNTFSTLCTEESQGRRFYDHHPSNEYTPNNYVGKTWQNLSITRGKGFTKEKNKKLRGSTDTTLRIELPPNTLPTPTLLALLSTPFTTTIIQANKFSLFTEESRGRKSYDHHPSREYIPYAYAEKASRDLSITRGQGFAREKNNHH
ncbi:hypothetical protein BP00DRAFT_468519 [Aspergillus indologenus CBS 114.80]|uniref:Srp40 C-terminal domain-containing protein n=1 Tax=Aspergillus indologenus CBS 114.80 TaxID=1450541 RepID=A0A2V5HSA2_9EURO|nr:hypothetical protein BP00DRAFT_468519 [Aspergillus indologenus CBS 114.80]